ncbi:MAG TPA: glycerophosphodiester phosphodiesterase [Candidatus Didemnitutus sp.]|jgi:glycerophosphoryl diester phosphodiesterase
MTRPLVVAHRGASAEAPENTLPAFRRAVAIGVDAIELDVQTTADGVPVVFHDFDLHRLTGNRGRMAKFNWSELRKLRVAQRERIPCLREVLRAVDGKVVVQIELKKGVSVAPVVAAIRSARASSRVILASFEPDLLRDSLALAPRIPRMLINAGRCAAGLLRRRLRRLRAIGLSVDHRAVHGAAWMAGFRREGFAVWTWTVNRPSTMRRLLRTGVDGLVSDNPALLRREVRLFSSTFPVVRGRTKRDDYPARSTLR